MAAAIITPARLDLDSRMSSVIIALPPAERHLLRELVQARLAARAGRVAPEPRAERRIGEQALDQPGGDVGFRGGGHAITSPQPLPQRLAEDEHHRQEERGPQRAHHAVHDRLGHARARKIVLVAQRHRDREAAPRARPSPARTGCSASSTGESVGAPCALQPALELLLRAPPQPRLAQRVDEDVVAVALDERVEVEERADVGREREVEEDVAHGALGQQQRAQREHRAQREVRHRARGR